MEAAEEALRVAVLLMLDARLKELPGCGERHCPTTRAPRAAPQIAKSVVNLPIHPRDRSSENLVIRPSPCSQSADADHWPAGA
jgi:hypothetical protein